MMMRRLFCYTLIAAVLAAPSARAQDAQAVIKTAEYALGMIRGPQRIDAINTLEYWGTGSTYAFGQAYHPGSAWPEFKATYHASLSYAVPAMRVDMTRSNPDGLDPGRRRAAARGASTADSSRQRQIRLE